MTPTTVMMATTATTDASRRLDDDDRGVLDALAAASGSTVQAAELLSREPSGRGLVSGWRTRLAGDPTDHLVYIETVPRGGSREGVTVLRDGLGDERAAWIYPHDPALPALAAVTVPEAAAVLLRRLAGGPAIVGQPPRLELLAYRAGKRAVIRVTGDEVRYLKVVAPKRAHRIHETHARWRAAGLPVPESLAWSPDGLLVLTELPGPSAVSRLVRVVPEHLADAVADLTARITAIPSTEPARASLAERGEWYASQFARLHPDDGDRVRRALHRAARMRREGASGSGTVHGDLHLGQIVVDPADASRITGVLDVDTAGVGDPADDAAAMWAHLVATADLRDRASDQNEADAATRLADLLQRRWVAGMRNRVAAIAAVHLVGHALSGHLSGRRATEVVDRLIDAPDESPLTAAS